MNNVYYHRAIENQVLQFPQKIKLILGARQTGKTTLLKYLLEKQSASTVHMINFQDRRVRRRYEKDDSLLLREIDAENHIHTILIDEIQKVPRLFDDLHYIFDQHRNKYQIWVTGSSARQLKRKSSNLLPGRVHHIKLSPVLIAEQRDAFFLPLNMPEKNKFPVRNLKDYLLYGNLPGLYAEEKSSWISTLEAYAELYIENEVRQENIVNDMGAFLRFLKLAALESGKLTNISKLAKSVGVAANTIRNFYQILEDTYVGIRILPFGKSKKRITASPRFLIFDIGLRHMLAELAINDTLLKLDAGSLFEQWIMLELYYRCKLYGNGYSISTWRTKSGAEVDVILETPEEIIPIEIKYTENPTPSEARHIETFIDLHQDMSKRGYIICRAPFKQKLTNRVIALPWSVF
jgi:predicted AAA+ superfamily ATPase